MVLAKFLSFPLQPNSLSFFCNVIVLESPLGKDGLKQLIFCLDICLGQHSPGFFLTMATVVRAGQLCCWFHSPYSGLSAYYQIHTWVKLLMGPFMYTAGSHNSHKGTSDHRWRSNFLWERVGAKRRNILYHHEADVTVHPHVIFIQSFIDISVDTWVILCLNYNPVVHYLFYCSTCPNFGHWELSLFGPCVL